ncbi:MAG: serine hydrolase domain-containing protein [Ardenticatenaceae bacterium]
MSIDKQERWEYFEPAVNVVPSSGLEDRLLSEMSEMKGYLSEVSAEGGIPGAVLLIAREGQLILHEAFGQRQLVPNMEPMTSDTIFDLASLTKIVATWPAVFTLIDEGRLELHQPVKHYLDLPATCPAAEITIAHLLTHTSGLPTWTYLRQYGAQKKAIMSGICSAPLQDEIGKQVLYSDRGFLLLAYIVEVVSGKSLSQHVYEQIWQPLGMKDTFFNPPRDLRPRIAPTEYRQELNACQRGSVHDENAAWLGGVAGNAGVFSTSRDLASFCAMIMAGGKSHGRVILSPDAISSSLCNHTPGLNQSRGYAWVVSQKKSREQKKIEIYSHLGFTGTAIWLIPALDMFVLLLTNRVHPSRQDSSTIQQVRQEIIRRSISASQ